MKKILCFGDSNTYGYRPKDGVRYPKGIRWTGILAEMLGHEYDIIEAGLSNRNCFVKNPFGDEFCGQTAILEYRGEFDILIFALGINDLQSGYNLSKSEFEAGLYKTVLIAQNTVKAKTTILLVPPKLTRNILKGNFSTLFNENSINKSRNLSEIYKRCAAKTQALLLDLNDAISVSAKDGLHLEPDAHGKIAKLLASIILRLS